jgi:hypothetical protein
MSRGSPGTRVDTLMHRCNYVYVVPTQETFLCSASQPAWCCLPSEGSKPVAEDSCSLEDDAGLLVRLSRQRSRAISNWQLNAVFHSTAVLLSLRDFAYFEEFGKPTVEDNWPQILAMLINSQGLILAELVNEIMSSVNFVSPASSSFASPAFKPCKQLCQKSTDMRLSKRREILDFL